MPKIVDHEARRTELADAVGRVIARDGVNEVSIRSVAAEAGWSPGALRHYFTTRAELLAFACEQVIQRVTDRITELRHTGTIQQAVRDTLLETMPVDARRHTEATVAFAFLALGLSDPRLAEVQRTHFNGMYGLCLQLIESLDTEGLLTPRGPSAEILARRLHAVVDGLSIQRLAGHLTPESMITQLDAYLGEIIHGTDATR
ncbi:TetR/AcrR family transcriptional regulator [Actinoallomurus rhizosphaericola]|uniref:TetR/AcrR family transcriptional regulator n=1 Tax=Actinoallomurus rhizosphaericola TaxID=2952536 RepID=UPI00209226EB|nr:TetR/AcrR family transcriptional regulator [Actinoallomurus rhizosphaericola]MCO5997726.1 TetR/AcrR family transcriptional regulator [Actinoallomurus rhizosphaericola]